MSHPTTRFLFLLASLSLVLPLAGCCAARKGKNAAMVQCRSTASDNTTCKACCTRAGARSGFHSRSMGCECTP